MRDWPYKVNSETTLIPWISLTADTSDNVTRLVPAYVVPTIVRYLQFIDPKFTWRIGFRPSQSQVIALLLPTPDLLPVANLAVPIDLDRRRFRKVNLVNPLSFEMTRLVAGNVVLHR